MRFNFEVGPDSMRDAASMNQCGTRQSRLWTMAWGSAQLPTTCRLSHSRAQERQPFNPSFQQDGMNMNLRLFFIALLMAASPVSRAASDAEQAPSDYVVNPPRVEVPISADESKSSAKSSIAFECSPTIGGLLIYAEGWVNLNHSARGDWTIICNLKSEWKGVSMQTCALWASTLQDAKNRGKPVSMYFYGNTGDTCETLPTYSGSPPPVYIGRIQ